MKFFLGKSEAASDGIARINRELCARTRIIIGNYSGTADSKIFELRKIMKKLRALLRITRPATGKKPYRELDRLMRDFSRELGRPRDSAVLLETFDLLLEHYHPYPNKAVLLPVRDALLCRYQVTLEQFSRNMDQRVMSNRFNVIEQRISNLDLHRCSQAMLLAGIEKTYRRCQARLKDLRDEPSTENSHELRRQIKYTWNQLKLIRKQGNGAFKPLLDDLNRIGKLLGADSDIALLVETLQRHPEICCKLSRCEFICALAEARRIALLSASLHLADRALARSPDDFSNWLRHVAVASSSDAAQAI